MHLLHWMNAMLDFICIGFNELWGTVSKPNMKMKIDVSRGIQTNILAYRSWHLRLLCQGDWYEKLEP